MTQKTSDNPQVSVVIVNWNTCDLLKNCLDSVYAQTAPDLLEVIVVDNGSADDSCQMVQQSFPQVNLIGNKTNLGFARANNQGFEIAQGRYLLMLNSDTVILDNAIEKTVHFADRHPNAAAVGCKLLYPDGTFQSSSFRFPSLLGLFLTSTYISQIFRNNSILNWDRYGCRDWPAFTEVDCVMGSFMLIRRSAIDQLGPLDADYFMFGEETDFCCRAKKAGLKVLYYPHAHIIHVHSGSQKTWADRAWAYSANQRGIIFFLCKWRHAAAGYIANLLIVLFMIPRIIAWSILDVFSSITNLAALRPRRLLKASAFPFHVKAVFQPVLLRQKWTKQK